MEFKLPEMGEGVNEGELVKWCVKVGDKVKDDQPLCEVMTDKATVEIPSPFTGVVNKLFAKEGETVEVQQVLMSYDEEGSVKASASDKKYSQKQPVQVDQPVQVATAAVSSASQVMTTENLDISQRVLAAPSTRKYARELNVPLQGILGSGPRGRVMKSDIDSFLTKGGVSNHKSVEQKEERVAFKGLRKKISEKMRLSKDHAVHFTYVEEANVTQLVELRKQAKLMGAQEGIKITYLPFVMKAMVPALKKYPILNSTLDESSGEIVYKHYYHFGLSVQTDDGLVAPVIKNVDQKSILDLAKEIQDMVERARNKRLTQDDFKGGTMTLTNAGSIGGLFATPVINYPEVAILGFNKIFKKPVVETVNGEDQVVIRDWTYFSISLDHRVVDGAIGAEFMKTFIQYIENPALLVLGN